MGEEIPYNRYHELAKAFKRLIFLREALLFGEWGLGLIILLNLKKKACIFLNFYGERGGEFLLENNPHRSTDADL